MKEQILSLFREAGLAKYAEDFSPLIRPSIRLFTHPANEDDLPLGSSKIGGTPDLPPHFEWPRWKVYTMSFLGQINLAELPNAPGTTLPKKGILYFFYAVSAMYDDDDFYDSTDTARVLYFEGDVSELKRHPYPPDFDDYIVDDQETRFALCSLTFSVEWTVPPSESANMAGLGMSWSQNREDYDTYWDVFLPKHWEACIANGGNPPINRLLGNPEQIQGDMQCDCVRYLRDDCSDKADLLSEAKKWHLLLQLDSEEEKTKMMWGDVGCVYFWIHEDDLARGNFDNVICIMQCS
ncbi:YwqG family protein [Brevibacillus sp. SYSU BS000544]|uniref:YwqG family protein n=1 Tax=Brevibacillus sp. SYSU BS000544 TaxID=3416443 RepID=UPI003CE45F59